MNEFCPFICPSYVWCPHNDSTTLYPMDFKLGVWIGIAKGKVAFENGHQVGLYVATDCMWFPLNNLTMLSPTNFKLCVWISS